MNLHGIGRLVGILVQFLSLLVYSNFVYHTKDTVSIWIRIRHFCELMTKDSCSVFYVKNVSLA